MNNLDEQIVEKVSLEEEQLGAPPPKRGILKWVIIGLVVGAAVFAGWKLLLDKPGASGEELAEVAEPLKPPPFGEVFRIDDLIINPAGGRRVFMVSVILEVTDRGSLEDLKRRDPLLRDNLITLFAAQPVEVLADIRYRQAFRSRVKRIMDFQIGEGKVSRVFFDKWVFQ